MSRKREEAKH